MRYLNKGLFLVLGLFVSADIFCQANSFNAVFNLKADDNVDGKNTLIIGVAAERSEGKYKLMVDSYGEALKLSNGNEVFTGKADSTIRQEHYLPLDITGEGEGEITARLYMFTDSMDIDSSSKREFVVKYSVKRKPGTDKYDIALSDTKEKHETIQNDQTASTTTPATTTPGQLTMTEMQQAVEASPDNAQKFIINTQKRYNGFLRGLLFVFSFFILGYLCYRILNKKN
jgi:hypothetical protein